MTSTEPRLDAAAETFESLNPATGEVIGRFPVHGPEEVRAAVSRAREAAGWWRALGFDGRRQRLRAFRALIARRGAELVELVHAENGKPIADGWVELLMAGNHLSFAARNAERVLKARRVPSGVLTAHHRARVEYRPVGVAGIITPWNYPLTIPVADMASALGAGNAVVLKPSELTPAVAAWVVEAFREVVPEQPVVELVTGLGPTGAALCRAGVDKVAFTGSVATGRTVMATCAETLTPVNLELGGKDPMIVDDDADVDAAVHAAAFGAFWNAGQTCISIERAYVTEPVYDRFVAGVVERARGLRAGSDRDARIGPMTSPAQVGIVSRHVEDALSRGARAVLGGPESIRPPYIDPIVLVDVPDDALIMTEETFGPTLPVVRVRDAEEALERANRSAFGLGAAVFGKRRAGDLARRLRSGAAAVNNAMSFYAVGALPLGGVGDSGFGAVHGADGLRNFSRPKAINRRWLNLGRLYVEQFDHLRVVDRALPLVARLVHGRR